MKIAAKSTDPVKFPATKTLASLLLLISSLPLEAQGTDSVQSWTSSDGRVIQAKFVKLDGDVVVVEKNGKPFDIPYSKLSASSVVQAKALARGVPTPTAAQQKQAKLPLKVDLEPEYGKLGLTPRAQGGRGTCTLFAITAVAEFEYNRTNRKAPVMLSEEFLVWAANEATGLTGDQAMFTEAVHGLNALGICQANLAPYQQTGATPPSGRAVADARMLADRWKVNWVRRWSLDHTLSEGEFLTIKTALANGHPVAVGLRWPTKLQGAALLDVPQAGDVFDGHTITFTGYEDDATKQGGGVFLFRNSSGPRWGQNGYGIMSYLYARTYANDALWLECGASGSEKPTERFEAESLKVTAQENGPVNTQDMDAWGGRMWSGSKQLFCKAGEGGCVEFAFRVSKAGRYRVRLFATVAPDFGTIRARIDGKPPQTDFDLFAGRVSPSEALELGEHQLTAGKHTLGVSVVGKNLSSQNYYFGLDTLDLIVLE